MGIIAKKKKDKKSFQTVLKEFPSEVKKDWKMKTAILMIAPIALLIDQITKSLVVRFIPLYGSLWGDPYEGILRIIHVRNTAIAFGLGRGFADEVKTVLFILLPLIIVISLIVYSLYKNEQPLYQRIAFALIIGGGFGNLADRIFQFGSVSMRCAIFRFSNCCRSNVGRLGILPTPALLLLLPFLWSE